MSNMVLAQAKKLAANFGLAEFDGELINTLKQTAFKGQVSDAQMSALLIVASQYGLNPWTKEIYAFPDKGAIVPVVGVDGWTRIMNAHAQFDGVEFEQDLESCKCTIWRKDRSRPIVVTEFMDECKRPTGPWNSHPRRMLRHKALVQCARLAFGFAGIYDADEAERIIESSNLQPAPTVIDVATGEIKPQTKTGFDLDVEKRLIDDCQSVDEMRQVAQAAIRKANAAKDKDGALAIRSYATEMAAILKATAERDAAIDVTASEVSNDN